MNNERSPGRGRVPAARAVDAFDAVLPGGVSSERLGVDDAIALVKVAGRRVRVGWAGEGWVGDVRAFAEPAGRVDVVAARRLSPGAVAHLRDAGIGWVDELGNAEIAFGNVVVARAGRTQRVLEVPPRWTPAFVSVAEAVLCGVPPTVSAARAATGLSTGTCTNALRAMTDLGLLEAAVARGRGAGRHVVDPRAFLAVYADAARALASPLRVTVGVTWRDPIDGLRTLSASLLGRGVEWAATGAVAAALDAPLITNIGSASIYVGAPTVAALEALARSVGLNPIEGGRLELRPMPIGWTAQSRRLIDGQIYLAPWPRVYVDLRDLGVRGEDAAEHLADQHLEGIHLG